MKNKNKILIIAQITALILMAGCSSEDTLDGALDRSKELIQFGIGSVQNTDTRGETVLEIPTSGNNQFRVYVFEAPALGNNLGNSSVASQKYSGVNSYITITNTTGGLSYSNYYWPAAKNNRLKFSAYYPPTHSSLSSVTQSEISGDPYLKMTYYAADNPIDHTDLLYASSADLYHIPTVALDFKHALTKLSFYAQVAPGGTMEADVIIQSIKISGVSKRGDLYIRGTNDIMWDISPYTKTPYMFSTGNGLTGEVLPLRENVGNRDEYVSAFTEASGDLMVVPQSLDEMMMEVVIEVHKIDGNVDIEKNYFIPAEDYPWAPGTHIRYWMTVARDVILTSADIQRWEEGSGKVINLY